MRVADVWSAPYILGNVISATVGLIYINNAPRYNIRVPKLNKMPAHLTIAQHCTPTN